MLRHSPADGIPQEQTTKLLELNDDEPHLIYRMIQYCYSVPWSVGQRIFPLPGETDWISCLAVLVKMYAIGDKYDLKGLRSVVVERFKRALEWVEGVEDPETETQEFLDIVPLVYQLTQDDDDSLRRHVIVHSLRVWGTFSETEGWAEFIGANLDWLDDVMLFARTEYLKNL